MTEMTLRFQGRSRTLTLPAAGWQSHGKGSEQHAFLTDPQAPPPFRELFVKRYRGRPAPAHGLLLRLLHEDRHGAAFPHCLGHAADGEWQHYAFARLTGCHVLSLVTGNRKAPHAKTLTPALCVAVLNASLRAFAFLHREGYYYADYAFENMLVRPQRGAVILIDVDSAFPLTRAATAADCRQTWWTLFADAGLGRLEYLNATMLMSMALVTALALAALRRRGPAANVADILRADPGAQRDYFRLLRSGDAAGLARLLCPAGPADPARQQQLGALCAGWSDLLSAMRRGEPVAWPALRDLGIALFALADPGNRYVRQGAQPSAPPPPANAPPGPPAAPARHPAPAQAPGGIFPAWFFLPPAARAAAASLPAAAAAGWASARARRHWPELFAYLCGLAGVALSVWVFLFL